MLIDDSVYMTPKWKRGLGESIEDGMLSILESINDYDLRECSHWDKGVRLEYKLYLLNGFDVLGKVNIVATNDGCLSVELSVLNDGDTFNHYTEWGRYDQPTTWLSVFFGMLDERGCFVDEG